LALVLGDVAGKGMSAALMMSSLQARVQLLTEDPMDLPTLVGRLDKSIAATCPTNRFVTFFMCLIDPTTGKTTYCNAGHNPALVVRASGKVETLKAIGTVLGILPELGYESEEGHLDPGDLIAVYSDGVTEAQNPDEEEFGEERLARLVAEKRGESASAIIEAVNQSLSEWCDSAPAEDDITMIVARRVS
jgi:sigma-B regulation protein RsbU (phosphoserine phosphatase)